MSGNTKNSWKWWIIIIVIFQVSPTPWLPCILPYRASQSLSCGKCNRRKPSSPSWFFQQETQHSQKCHSKFDRELLAIHLAVQHFHHLSEGIPFSLNTNHQPLVHAFFRIQDAWSATQQRHLLAISKYNCTIRHVLRKKTQLLTPFPGLRLRLCPQASATMFWGTPNEKTPRSRYTEPPSPACSGMISLTTRKAI